MSLENAFFFLYVARKKYTNCLKCQSNCLVLDFVHYWHINIHIVKNYFVCFSYFRYFRSPLFGFLCVVEKLKDCFVVFLSILVWFCYSGYNWLPVLEIWSHCINNILCLICRNLTFKKMSSCMMTLTLKKILRHVSVLWNLFEWKHVGSSQWTK